MLNFVYLRLKIKKVSAKIIKKKIDINKKVLKEKYQLILKIRLTNIYDKTDEKIKAKNIIGTKIAINSIIKTVKRFKLFKPKILKTRF